MAAMTTPYGTTTFRQEAGDPALPDADLRRIEATDPLGATERLEFHRTSTLLPAQAPANEVPAGFAVANDYLHWYNTFYWDKQAMAVAPGAVESAVITMGRGTAPSVTGRVLKGGAGDGGDLHCAGAGDVPDRRAGAGDDVYLRGERPRPAGSAAGAHRRGW